MKLLTGFLKIAGVVICLFVWGLVPDLLWDHGYKFLATITFILIPYCLLYFAFSYGEWRKSLFNH